MHLPLVEEAPPKEVIGRGLTPPKAPPRRHVVGATGQADNEHLALRES